MADRSNTSRVGRPRARSAHQTPKSTAKVGRPRSKSAQKPKAKATAKKTTIPTKRAVRPILQLEWDMVEANQRPFGDQLPDLPLDLEQGDNIPLNPPNQPLDLLVREENQQNQAEEPNQNLPPEQEEPDQPNHPPNQPEEPDQPDQSNQLNLPPNPPQNLPAQIAHPHQLNWSYFKTEFSGKPEEDAWAHLLRTDDWMELTILQPIKR